MSWRQAAELGPACPRSPDPPCSAPQQLWSTRSHPNTSPGIQGFSQLVLLPPGSSLTAPAESPAPASLSPHGSWSHPGLVHSEAESIAEKAPSACDTFPPAFLNQTTPDAPPLYKAFSESPQPSASVRMNSTVHTDTLLLDCTYCATSW